VKTADFDFLTVQTLWILYW